MEIFKLATSDLKSIDSKIIVKENPFPHAIIEDFLPQQIVKKLSMDFTLTKNLRSNGDEIFQKTKCGCSVLQDMPYSIQSIINFFHSKYFISILEKKFNLTNLLFDPTLRGGGMHESFKGGYLKIHSDFIFMRKTKFCLQSSKGAAFY